jgi:hypothetical protein
MRHLNHYTNLHFHYVLHYILNEIGQIYHSENVQPLNKQGTIGMDKWIHQ